MIKGYFQNYKYSKYLVVFFVIVMIDFISKILANNLLPYNEIVQINENNFCLYLTYNFGFIGSIGSILLSKLPIKNLMILFSCFNVFIVSIYIIIIKKFRLDKVLKLVFGFSLYYFLFFPEIVIVYLFKNINLSNHFVSWFSKFGILFFCTTIFFKINDTKLKLILTFIIGSGFGNLISHFYPPFYVIDFIYVKFLFNVFRIGIFNLADIIYYLSILTLIIYFIIAGFKKIFPKLN
jgi:lipoprotein signal peptidase